MNFWKYYAVLVFMQFFGGVSAFAFDAKQYGLSFAVTVAGILVGMVLYFVRISWKSA